MDGLSIAASLTEVRAAVEGGVVRSIHRPLETTFVLGVFEKGNHRVFLSPERALIQKTGRTLPNPKTPDRFVMLLRKHLRGARIERVRQAGLERVVTFDLVRRDGDAVRSYELIVELTGIRGNLLLVENGVVLGADRTDPRNLPGRPYTPMEGQPKTAPAGVSAEQVRAFLLEENVPRALVRGIDGVGRATAEELFVTAASADSEADRAGRLVEALRAMAVATSNPQGYVKEGERLATFYPPASQSKSLPTYGEALDYVFAFANDSDTPDEEGREQRTTRQQLLAVAGRKKRTAVQLRQWLSASERASEMRRGADLVMLNAVDLGSGTREAVIPDPMSDELLRIPLNPALDGLRNAQWLYKKARKLDRGRASVTQRLQRIEREIELLEAAATELTTGRGISAEAEALLPAPARARRPAPLSAPRQFQVDGYAILVGKSAAQNDQLLRDASPEDAWLHVRDAAGSHVIVRHKDRTEIPESVLREAAKLAVRYSQADPHRRAQVTVTKAKHVRKPKGAPAGLVIVRNEDTLTVEPEGSKGSG